VYTANVDMTGSIRVPDAGVRLNTCSYYSTYVLMRNSSGVADSIYVLDANGDLKAYSYTLPGADIVGPLWWSAEPGGHFVYFGTSAGEVYRLLDNGSSLVNAGGDWATAYSDSTNLLAVTSPVISDGVNLYFAGQSSSTPTYALYMVEIATKTARRRAFRSPTCGSPRDSAGGISPDSIPLRRIGRPEALLHGRADATLWTGNAVFGAGSLSTPADDCTSDFTGNISLTDYAGNPVVYLYAGEANGYLHAVDALGTFSTQRPGFPFRDKVSAIQTAAIVDFNTGRVFFGNAAGDIYVLKNYTTTWTGNFFCMPTPGGSAIQGTPLYTYGVLYASNAAGQLFLVDANDGSGWPSIFRTYTLGTAGLGDVSRDPVTGRIYVASAGGRLHAIDGTVDPTSGTP
jgi:hypothetical protein